MCHAVAVAQQDLLGNNVLGNTPDEQSSSPSPTISRSNKPGPTTPGSSHLGVPFMGTSTLAGSGLGRPYYTPTGPPLAGWGPIEVYPHLAYTFSYGNGVQARPGVNSTTAINTVAPGTFLKIGDHWSIDYTPSLDFYSNPLFHNTTDQNVVLNGIATNGNWVLKLSQSYIDTTQPLAETGTQIEQEAYLTALNANWQMTGNLSLQLGVNQNFRVGTGVIGLQEWSTADWFNYQFQPQLAVALGVTGGYDELSAGSDMPFEQILGRVIFQPGSKLYLVVSGGYEDRQFVRPSAPALVGPVFQAYAMYQALEGTLFSFGGDRTVTPSLFENEVNTITSVTADIRQKIVGKMFFKISGGYTSEPFTSIEAAPLPKYYFGAPPRTPLQVTRADTRTFVEFTLSTTFRARLTGSVFYRLIASDSSQANFNYSGNQVGLELNYRY
jgi:hypothetical protein